MESKFVFLRSLSIFGIFLIVSCNPKPAKEVFIIPEGKVGMIGIGSLTSKEQMESQLGKPYDGPFRVIHLEGYQRHWNFLAPNDSIHPPFNKIIQCVVGNDTITPQNCIYLTIREEEGKSTNGCFFVIDESDLQVMDQTEIGYERIEVTNSIREFEVEGGTVYAYQALPMYSKEPSVDQPLLNAIPSAYLEFLNTAFKDLGEEYKREFYSSIVKYDESLVLDCFISEIQ